MDYRIRPLKLRIACLQTQVSFSASLKNGSIPLVCSLLFCLRLCPCACHVYIFTSPKWLSTYLIIILAYFSWAIGHKGRSPVHGYIFSNTSLHIKLASWHGTTTRVPMLVSWLVPVAVVVRTYTCTTQVFTTSVYLQYLITAIFTGPVQVTHFILYICPSRTRTDTSHNYQKNT